MRCDRGDFRHYGPLELHAGENLLAFRDICYSPQDALLGSYNTACYVKVISGEFAGLGEWECDWKSLLQFAEELEQMYHFQRREVEFRDIEWGSWLKFALHQTGQIAVCGFLCGRDGGSHTLEFEFWTDQTYLRPFLQQLKQLNEASN